MYCSNCNKEMEFLYKGDHSYIEEHEYINEYGEVVSSENVKGCCDFKYYCDECNNISGYYFSQIEELEFEYDVEKEDIVDFVISIAVDSAIQDQDNDEYNLEAIKSACAKNNLDYDTIKSVCGCRSVAETLARKYDLFDNLYKTRHMHDDEVPF